MRAQGVIWEPKLIKLGDKLIYLRACGVTGNDFRAWGMIWERELKELGQKLSISGPQDKLCVKIYFSWGLWFPELFRRAHCSTWPLTRSGIGAKLHRLVYKSIDVRAWERRGVI